MKHMSKSLCKASKVYQLLVYIGFGYATDGGGCRCVSLSVNVWISCLQVIVCIGIFVCLNLCIIYIHHVCLSRCTLCLWRKGGIHEYYIRMCHCVGVCGHHVH